MLVESQFLTARQLSELATNPRDHSDEDWPHPPTVAPHLGTRLGI